MGPTCEVLLESCDEAVLLKIDALLAATTNRVDRTRKGKVWDVWIEERPIHVKVLESESCIELAAGCNDPVDREFLIRLAENLATSLGGIASIPVK